MKKLFLLIAFTTISTVMWAQNEVMGATLQTGNEVKTYTGVNALVNAYNEADETGSVITLTAGTFNSPNYIKKSVKIYGFGWEVNEDNNILTPTVINSYLSFQTDNDETSLQDVLIEGVRINGDVNVKQITNLTISRCSFNTFAVSGNNAQSILLRQCYIGSFYTINTNISLMGLDVENCFIKGRINMSLNPQSQIMFNHCIIRSDNDYGHSAALYTNNIFGSGYRTDVATDATLKNNILTIGVPSSSIQEGNWYNVPVGTIFSDATDMNYTATRTFTLADPATYVGTDGTEVGINGGSYPWNKIPTTPIVKSLELEVNGSNLNVTYEAEVR